MYPDTPALEVLLLRGTALGAGLHSAKFAAFWTGAVQGISALPFVTGQRHAVENHPRELTDAEYDHVTDGLDNAAAAEPRIMGQALVGGAGGAMLGAAAQTMFGGHMDVADNEAAGHWLPESLQAAPWALGGGLAGAGAGVVHGAYMGAKNQTTENIDHLDDGTTVADRHPWATNAGKVLVGANAVLNPVSIATNAMFGGATHGIETLRGRAHSQVA